jgi:branched-chain amino acid transport system substrate-binding protein
MVVGVASLTLLVGGLAACSSGGGSSAGGGSTINIGVCAAFTGGVIAYGQPWLQGVQVAADNINANGGADGSKVKLITCDTKGDPVDAVTTVRRMLATDHIAGEVGLAGVHSRGVVSWLN